MNQYIDVIYYINLDHRTDRNEEFLEEMCKMEIDPEKLFALQVYAEPMVMLDVVSVMQKRSKHFYNRPIKIVLYLRMILLLQLTKIL